MKTVTLFVMLGLQAVAGLAQRFPQHPIVTPVSSVTLGDNLAYADALAGPWRIHEPGTLRLDPGIFSENGKTYLLYSIAGESGLAISELAAPRTR